MSACPAARWSMPSACTQSTSEPERMPPREAKMSTRTNSPHEPWSLISLPARGGARAENITWRLTPRLEPDVKDFLLHPTCLASHPYLLSQVKICGLSRCAGAPLGGHFGRGGRLSGKWPWCPGKCHILPYHPGALAGAAAVCGGRFLDLFLPRPWSPLGRQNEHFAWLWRLDEGPGP